MPDVFLFAVLQAARKAESYITDLLAADEPFDPEEPIPADSMDRLREALKVATSIREHFESDFEPCTISGYLPGLTPREVSNEN